MRIRFISAFAAIGTATVLVMFLCLPPRKGAIPSITRPSHTHQYSMEYESKVHHKSDKPLFHLSQVPARDSSFWMKSGKENRLSKLNQNCLHSTYCSILAARRSHATLEHGYVHYCLLDVVCVVFFLLRVSGLCRCA
jgi:hypothetical protein